MHALLFIQSKPGITMKELAGLLRVTSPSTTSFVDRLVKLGHVRRARDVTNRKLVRLYLTDEGETSLKVTMEKRRDMLLDILSVLSPSEQESLRTVMQKLIANCSL